MRREIIRLFNRGEFFWRDEDGKDQIVSWGRLQKVPGDVSTVIEMVEAAPHVFDAIALDPDIIVGEEVE